MANRDGPGLVPDPEIRSSDSPIPVYPLFQSPLKMQAHCNMPDTTILDQLISECRWFTMEGYVLICFSHEIPSKLQDGPQCGIVALWMAIKSLLGDESIPSPVDIQKRAIELYFSAHGEMFSARNLTDLCNDVFSVYDCEAVLGKSFSSQLGSSFHQTLKTFVETDARILVPYDTDSDQRPGFRKGQKAHWGVLSGVAVSVPWCDFNFNTKKHPNLFLVDQPNLLIINSKEAASNLKVISEIFPSKPSDFYFVARQSKSKRFFFFHNQRLSQSNSNLVNFSRDPNRPHHMDFILPSGGIKEGLAGKYVSITRRKKSEQIDSIEEIEKCQS